MLNIFRHACSMCLRKDPNIYGVLAQRVQVRWMRNWYERGYKVQLYRRRLIAGPDAEEPRSTRSDWNYDSELQCFGIRLGEQFTDKTIRTAFIHKSYASQLTQERSDLPKDITVPQIEDNSKLIAKGTEVMSMFVKAYARYKFPRMPEECICSFNEFLTSDSTLNHIAANIGIKDLILAEEYPPSERTMANTFRAVIGALASDQGKARTEKFLQDFLMTHLIGKDINEYLGIIDPMGLLATLLQGQGMGEPEPRLIHSSGASTILANYMVGIYSNRQLLGKSFGETTMIAEEMAARDALRNLFGTTLHREPFTDKKPLNIAPEHYTENYRAPQHFQ